MKLVFSIALFLLVSKLLAQDYADHFYIYAKDKTEHGFDMEYGKYQLTLSGLSIDKVYDNIDSIYDSISRKAKKGIIFYIHGFTADNRRFESEMGAIAHKEFYSQISDQYDLIVSLRWTPEKDYLTTIPVASAKGRFLFPFTNEIIEKVRKNSPDCPITFIMHSMGNRIFENIYKAKEEADVEWSLNQVHLIAADVEDDIFFNSLKNLSSESKRIYFYYNIDDRVLGVAKAMKPHNRLGITGHKFKSTLPENIYPMDTTGTKDNEGMIASMTLHRYWYASPTWRKKIKEILKVLP